jgi:TPR repeat protein
MSNTAPLSSAAIAAAASASDVTNGRIALRDPKRDAEAVADFTRSAQLGNPVAQAYLGYLYYMGHGVRQNDQLAAEWYRRAAEQGFVDAEFRLGLLYRGRDLYDPARSLRRDDRQGIRWLQRAADHGASLAMTRIGWLYMFPEDGKALSAADREADRAKAMSYLEQASELGDHEAMYLITFDNCLHTRDEAERQKWCLLHDQVPWSPYGNDVQTKTLDSSQIPMASLDIPPQ